MKARVELGESETFELTRALLLYERGSHAFATVHPIRTRRGRLTVAEGQLLTRDVLDTSLRKISGLPQRRELLSAQVLAADGGRMMWWRPAERRHIWFKTKNEKFNRDLNGRRVYHPALLFVAEPGRLSVHALGGNDRPGPDTPVYRAPYFNLYPAGHMCRGNARYPHSLSVRDLPVWEAAFYETQFTHDCYEPKEKLCQHPQGHHGLWRELAKPSAGVSWIRGLPGRFPLQHLIRTRWTVEEVLNQ